MTHAVTHTLTHKQTHNMSQHNNMVSHVACYLTGFLVNQVLTMLSMVLLVLLLCFEPAKASLFQPAKATLFLGLCMQPAKARPPLPWWRCRVWENKYWLCSPDGYGRGLTEEEEDEIEEIFDRNTDAAKYVWQQSSEHLAGNCWGVSWDEPLSWYQYEEPQCRHPRLLPALGRLECLAA